MMIPEQDELLSKIQEAVCEFIDSTDKAINTFSLTVEITADEGLVFFPRVIERR